MAVKKPINIILLGDPASGKATHGKFLAKKFGLFDLDMGKELRALEHNPFLRKKYRLDKTLDSGKLTPTKLVRSLLHDRIHKTPKKQGILFNGTPKMLGEAKLVAKWLDAEKRKNIIFIYLAIPLKEIIRRMTGRKTYFRGKFSKRPDDNKNALRNRLTYYRVNIKQVTNFFKKHYFYKKVSTIGTIPRAKKRLIDEIKTYERRLD